MQKTKNALSLVPASQSLLKDACVQVMQKFAELGITNHSLARINNKLYVSASDLSLEQSEKLTHFLQKSIATEGGLQILGQRLMGKMVSMQIIDP